MYIQYIILIYIMMSHMFSNSKDMIAFSAVVTFVHRAIFFIGIFNYISMI